MGDITEKIDIVINESGGRTVKRSLDDIADSAQRGVQPVNQLNSSLGSGARAADIFFGSLKALGGILATIKLTTLITEAATLSQRYSELGIVLDVVGRNAGLTKTSVDATTEAVRKQGISMIESRQIVTRMIQSQIDLSKATQLARLAQDAAVIGQINSSQALDRLVFGITSAQVEVLRGIGINVSFEQSYAKLAKEMGVSQNALSENEKLQARLNVVLGEAAKISGVYEGAMANAGKQMRSTERIVEDLKVKVGGLFDQTSILAVTAYTNALKEADASVDNLTEAGRLKAWGDSIARIAAFAADSVRSVGIVFDITGKAIGAMAAQAVAISKFDFNTAFKIQGDFNKDFDDAIGSMSKMRDLVESQIIERDLLTKASDRETISLKANTVELAKNTEEAKKDVDARNRFVQSLQTEVDSIGLNEFAIKRMEAAKLGATKAAAPFIDALEQENNRLNQQSIQVNQITSDLNKYKQVTDSVKTDQEKFADTVSELDRLKNLTNGAAISQETYNRALKKANDEFIGVNKTGQSTFDSLNQYAIQASRNIQTSLANFLFDPFDDGLEGMVQGVANAVRRMVAEFAAMKISNSIGLSQLFGGGIGGTGTTSSAGFGFGDVLSAGSNIFTSLRGGVGSLLGRGASALGFSSFGAGASGAASAGVFGAGGANFLGGAGTALGTGAEFGITAGLGASMAAIAGPLIAVDIAGRLFGGNKTLGGAEMIPVIGGFLAGLFGHGPLKFRQQSLQGEVSSDGFDGDITNVFRAKGGLLVKNKHRSVTEQLSDDQQKTFDAAITGFYRSAHGFAENLGLSTDLVDNFTQQLQIKSEKGKQLTEEAITEMLSGIGNSLAKNVLPSIDEFRKVGEKSFDTFTRLNTEFESLSSGAVNLGASLDYAKQLAKSMSIEARTAFVEMSGGVEALAAQTTFFAQNFLTDAERIAPVVDGVSQTLKSLGLSADITRDQFRALVQDVGLSNETRNALLKLAPAFIAVRNSADAAKTSTENSLKTSVGDAFSSLQKSVEADRRKITDKFNTDLATVNSRIQGVNDSISKLTSLSAALKSTTDTINPQSLSNARVQIRAAISSVAAGNVPDAESLKQSLDTLSNQDSSNFATLAEFQRSQAQSVDLIDQLKSTTGSQLTLEERSLAALEANRDRLQAGFDNEIARLDSILTQGQSQIDALNGINTSVLSLADALKGFNTASFAAGGQTAGVTTSGVSFKDIRDFSATHTPDQIYAAAKQYGVSQADIVASGAFTDAQVTQYLMSKGLASFDVGGYVPKTGLALIHKDEQVLTSGQQDAITSEIKQMREELSAALALIAGNTGSAAEILDQVSGGGTAFLTEAMEAA
ncbi:MAG: hypothetical protein K2Q14_07005 [Gammaproteobacteria bacterium]|nr:hypothetical protein [Nitrosomonas sp.]MBY0545276.1 hypothetical protein [Gammaproteobacteria bacterium]